MLPSLLVTLAADPSLLDVGGVIVTAILGKKYTLLGCAALVLLVYAARKAGAKAVPWFATPRGSAFLAFLGGGSTWLLTRLALGESMTPDLISEAINAALAASGLWSTGKALVEKRPTPEPMGPPICTPIEIANGTCKP